MSNKVLGLGSVAAAANGITCSTSTNATPIVATFGAGHGLKNGDRVAISGITGNTAANGEWTLNFTAATTAQLLGSAGNGAHGGTAVVSVICDTTPHMKGHACCAVIGNTPGAAVFVGTLLIEGSADNTTFATALPGGSEAIPAATAGIGISKEVVLSKYMRLRCSAYTSGAANAQLIS
jgi:hypothetical protein